MSKLEFNVISDIHYYAKSVGVSGPEFDRANSSSPMELRHNEEILNALVDRLIEDETKIVLVSGDTTHEGEPDSHAGCVKLLKRLQDAGKDVYVITATHDFQDDGLCWRYTENGREKMPATDRSELMGIYHDFGFRQALSVHEKSQSYVAQLAPGFRLFAINDDHNDEGASGIATNTMAWIDEQLEDARANGQKVVCMTHHPMISPSPMYSLIGAGDMMHEHVPIRNKFADSGVRFFFTGHTHIQDISYIYSENGNIFYDITTPAPAGYPATYRHAVYDSVANTLDVKAVRLERDPGFDTGGKPLEEYLRQKFFGMIGDMVGYAATDIHMFAKMANGISIRPWTTYRFAWIIKPIAKILNKLKVSTAAKLCRRETGLKKADYADVADKRVVDVIVELAQNLYGGDGCYTPDTSIYKITMGVCGVIDSIIRTLGIKLNKLLKGTSSVSDLIRPLLYNDGICDEAAVLDLDAKAQIKTAQYEDTVRKSRKGPAIIIIGALLIIALLPLELITVAAAYVVNKIRYGKLMKKN